MGTNADYYIAPHQPPLASRRYLLTIYRGYLDLRYFKLGFGSLLLFVTGMSNIRDVIPFPRFPGSAAF